MFYQDNDKNSTDSSTAQAATTTDGRDGDAPTVELPLATAVRLERALDATITQHGGADGHQRHPLGVVYDRLAGVGLTDAQDRAVSTLVEGVAARREVDLGADPLPDGSIVAHETLRDRLDAALTAQLDGSDDDGDGEDPDGFHAGAGRLATDGGTEVVWTRTMHNGDGGIVLHTKRDCPRLQKAKTVREHPRDSFPADTDICEWCDSDTDIDRDGAGTRGPWTALDEAEPGTPITDGGGVEDPPFDADRNVDALDDAELVEEHDRLSDILYGSDAPAATEENEPLYARIGAVWSEMKERASVDLPPCPECGEATGYRQAFGDPLYCAVCGQPVDPETTEAVHDAWTAIKNDLRVDNSDGEREDDVATDGGRPTTAEDLTAFQRDCLRAIAALENSDAISYGLAIKEKLDNRYDEELNKGRIYPNLDYLVERGLVRKGEVDERANRYTLTRAGERVLRGLLVGIAADLGFDVDVATEPRQQPLAYGGNGGDGR